MEMGRGDLATPPLSPAPQDAAAGPRQAVDAGLRDQVECTAKLRGAVHLRLRPEKKASGPTLPKDTRLRVLDKVSDFQTERRSLSLYRVELEASRMIGYVYLRTRELAKTCPLLWPSQVDQSNNTPFTESPYDVEEACLRRGPAKSLLALLQPACRSERRELKGGLKFDVDGDGRMDRLFEISSQLTVVRDTPAGWTADIVAALAKDAFREEVEWLKPIRAGDALYVPYVEYGWENFAEEEGEDGKVLEAEHDQSNTVTLLRWLDDGQMYKVFEYPYDGEVEDCSFFGNSDRSVTLRCKPGSVRLHWDARRRCLVP